MVAGGGEAGSDPTRTPVKNSRRRLWAVTPAVVLPLVLAGCGGKQNVLHPESRPERRIATLWWVMLTGPAIAFGVIALLLFLGWARRNRDRLPFDGRARAAPRPLPRPGVALANVGPGAPFV